MIPLKAKCFKAPVLIVDGLPGCGKSMLSRIFASIDRIELMTYSYQIEWYCALHHFKNLNDDAARALISLEIDLKLYNLAMGREVNFRFSDLSSIYNYPKPEEYIRRTVSEGDDSILGKIDHENPILNISVHNLFPYSKILFDTLGDRLNYLHMVRHPIYMVKQQALNFDRFVGTHASNKDFTVYSRHENFVVPFYAHEWANDYITSNNYERAVSFISQYYFKIKDLHPSARCLTIPFEAFVLNPTEFIDQTCALLNVNEKGSMLSEELKRQNIPRSRFSDGQALDIYRRCGWRDLKAKTFDDEKDILIGEFDSFISKKSKDTLMEIVEWYEARYMHDLDIL